MARYGLHLSAYVMYLSAYVILVCIILHAFFGLGDYPLVSE
jgi:hypothetical protein